MPFNSLFIGVDFDNTIVCYDYLFHQIALEKQLIPAELPQTKTHVRDYLREQGQEDIWTEMQGYVYGKRMIEDAPPFEGVKAFFKSCIEREIPICIVSHKTRHPYKGVRYDLHQAARSWLKAQKFFENDIGLSQDKVFFELTKESKMKRIGLLGCTHFIDDLPEFLAESAFPKQVEKILFDPGDKHVVEKRFRRVQDWNIMRDFLIG